VSKTACCAICTQWRSKVDCRQIQINDREFWVCRWHPNPIPTLIHFHFASLDAGTYQVDGGHRRAWWKDNGENGQVTHE
jgi:hypothetical protein